MNENRAQSTARNILAAATSHIGSTVAVLLVTPVILAGLGLDAYGLWAVLNALAKYGSVADFGLGPALTRSIAEFHARGENSRIQQAVTFGFLFYIVAAVVIVPLFGFLAPIILSPLRLSANLAAVAPGIATGFIAWFFGNMALAIVPTLLTGLGELRTASRTNAAGQFAFCIAAGVLAHMGYGLRGMLAALWIQSAVSAILAFRSAFRSFGPFWLKDLNGFEPDVVRKFFTVGGWIQLSTLMVVIYAESGQIIVGYFVGVAAAGVYDIASKLARAVRALSFYFNSALLPAVAALEVQRGRAAATATIVDGSRYLGLVSFAFAGIIAGMAPTILLFWLGPNTPHADTMVMTIAVLSIVYVADNTVSVPITMLRGFGTPRLETAYSVVAAALHIILTIALAPRFGIAGILAGLLIGTIVASMFFLDRFARAQGASLRTLFGGWLLELTAATALATLVASGLQSYVLSFVAGSRLGALLLFVGLVIVFAVCGIGGLRMIAFFTAGDFTLFARIVPARGHRILTAIESLLTERPVQPRRNG